MVEEGQDYEKPIRSLDGVDNPNAVIVSESGLCRFTMTSRKHQAEPFQTWACTKVHTVYS